ncbi:DegT/DnrJ/EryC1/StrS aminotransferase family protein [Granulosicoccus sp.]|nr:DegT/DnrJ/EryC1/StrS aminotransferase family protein [Granulosicoccus sp.]MDB4222295.1 DegT/DnrJ/EryC1/StrS aminotransferase family protein [Granulosicoccus sp.]
MNRAEPPLRFTGNFTQQEAIPQDAIDAAIAVLQSGRLHRYNVATPDELSETAELEIEYARYQQQRFCLACASGGYAIQLALRAWGLEAGDPVLSNGFTLSPVPGAIRAVGGTPVLVETTKDLVIDLEHLEIMIQQSGARLLLLSHMRGHLVDMEALCTLLEKHGVAMIEDCAHTMGATFNGRKSGSHGVMACFSTQTYKHVNSGEGGFLTSDNDEMMAKAIVLSGSYMLFERHVAAPAVDVFEQIKLTTPNCSGRMDNLRAAILRPQLKALDDNGRRWNERYNAFASQLRQNANAIAIPQRHPDAYEVPSSIQFQIPVLSDEQNTAFLEECAHRGVDLKWFGAEEPKAYTSRYDSWQYIEAVSLPNTDELLRRLYDCRLPLTFSVEDCATIGSIIADVSNDLLSN